MKKFIFLIAILMFIIVSFTEFVSVNSTVSAFNYIKNKKPIYCVDTKENKVAISFDAAWGADKTKQILDILDCFEVHATFFLVGFWVEKYPNMVKEIDERGYEIGNHSQNHPQMSKLTKEQMKNEITSVNDKIYNIIGKKTDIFRPPYGDYNDTVISAMEELNMHTIQWSIDTIDIKVMTNEYHCAIMSIV